MPGNEKTSGKHQLPPTVQRQSSKSSPAAKFTSVGTIPKQKRHTECPSYTSSRSRSVSPLQDSSKSPPNKKSHREESDSDSDIQMTAFDSEKANYQSSVTSSITNSFLLTNFVLNCRLQNNFFKSYSSMFHETPSPELSQLEMEL